MDEVHRVNSDLPIEHRDERCWPAGSGANTVSERTATSRSAGSMPPAETTPYTIDAAIADALQQMTSKPFPDTPVQYWLWTGHRLMPASPKAAERFRQQEAWEQEELRHVHERQQACRQQRRQAYQHFAKRLVAPLLHVVEGWRLSRHTRQSWQEKRADS